MDDMNEIFSRATDADLDVEMAAAGELLQKIAEQEGIDLSQLSDEDVAELMVDLLPKTAADEGEHESAREESSEDRKEKKKKEEAKMASEITFADVAVELNKVAAAEGIDLDGLDRAQYHELFDIVAESMQDPEYFENKLAEDEANAKLAEADALGRYMAHAFMDELGEDKVAYNAEAAERARKKYRTGMTPESMEAVAHAANQERRAKAVADAAKRGPYKNPNATGFGKMDAIARKGQQEAAEEAAKKGRVSAARSAIKGKYEKHVAAPLGRAALTVGRAVGVANRSKAKMVGGALMAGGGLAAGAAGAYGARKVLGTDKQSFDQEALEMARGYLLESGIDPDTGDKLASFDEDDVAERAAEILAEAGWL